MRYILAILVGLPQIARADCHIRHQQVVVKPVVAAVAVFVPVFSVGGPYFLPPPPPPAAPVSAPTASSAAAPPAWAQAILAKLDGLEKRMDKIDGAGPQRNLGVKDLGFLSTKCLACHKGKEAEGRLDLERGLANLSDRQLVRMITRTNQRTMPPKDVAAYERHGLQGPFAALSDEEDGFLHAVVDAEMVRRMNGRD